MLTLGQSDVRVDFPRTPLAPFIDDELAVYPHPRAVVHQQVEAIGALVEPDGPRPAGREVVVGQSMIGRALPPVEIELLVVADDPSRALQCRVVPVASRPIRIGRRLLRGSGRRHCDSLPPDPYQGVTHVLVVLDSQVVLTRRQITFGGEFAPWSVNPGIDDQSAIQVQSNPVVHEGMEAIPSFVELQISGPTD